MIRCPSLSKFKILDQFNFSKELAGDIDKIKIITPQTIAGQKANFLFNLIDAIKSKFGVKTKKFIQSMHYRLLHRASLLIRLGLKF